MSKWRQLRLLLWKDYLIRKRKMITITGVIWTLAVLSSLYIVRVNIDNIDYPTCQFPARALPSAGMLNFLQSFVCTVNNECQPMDQFQEIPAYEKSKVSQLKHKVTPLLYNETLLELADLVPDSVRLLATLTDVVAGHIPTNGVRVEDIFANPERVRRHLAEALKMSDNASKAVMAAKINLQGILKGQIDRCRPESISLVLIINEKEYSNELANKLCLAKDDVIQSLFMDLIFEINFSKYIKMIGEMYTKLTGDRRLEMLSNTLTAVTRMSNVQSFMSPELTMLLQGREPDFAYFNITLISSLIDLFKPTFEDTEAFKNTKDVADAVITGIQFMSNFLGTQLKTGKDNVPSLILNNVANKLEDANMTVVAKAFKNSLNMFSNAINEASKFDIFKVLSKASNFALRWLDKEMKFNAIFYSTLLTKLIEAAQQVLTINMNIEEVTFNASLRHPEALKILVNLPTSVVEEAFEALVDADRTQLIISKFATPGLIFCDVNKLQYLLSIKNKDVATTLKDQLCKDVWKNYITDLVQSFGITSVKDNINSMASLLIQNTIGKDTTPFLYTIDHDFEVLKNFTNSLYSSNKEAKKNFDWLMLLNVTDESEFMKIARQKSHLGKQMLITVHGSMAKEVVNQNVVLSYKLTPFFKDVTVMTSAINAQLMKVPRDTVMSVREMYPAIVDTILNTALNEKKTYAALSAKSVDIFCNGVDTASTYVELPDVDQENTVNALCAASTSIEESLSHNSDLAQAITKIKNATHSVLDEVPWTQLITNLKQLYINMDANYTYLFEWGTYGMDQQKQIEVEMKVTEAKEIWFGRGSAQRSGQLGLNLLLRVLDFVDSPAFNITSENWMKLKYIISAFNTPLEVADQVVRLIAEVVTDGNITAVRLPEMTTLLLGDALHNLPYLVLDFANIIVKDAIELDPVVDILSGVPAWPCSTITLANLLPFSDNGKASMNAIERIMCFDELKVEWEEYFIDRNYSKTTFNWNKNNYTKKFYEPHLFLEFSRVFDNLLLDLTAMGKSLDADIHNDTDDKLSIGTAIKYTKELFNGIDRDVVLKKFFHKFDTVLNSVQLNATNVPLYGLWQLYANCTDDIEKDCNNETRALEGVLLKFLSVSFANIAGDLLTYFVEWNDPNVNILQIFGFTKSTGLYTLYDKFPAFLGVLLNSYFDYGFMNQVRRESNSHFWDCDALVTSLVPPAFSPITPQMIASVQPYVCPSLLYWISMPRGDNVFLDLVSKPQYYFYTLENKNLTSSFEEAYTKGVELTNFLSELAKTNKSKTETNINTLKENLKKSVDEVLTYKINKTNPSYQNFTEINQKQIAAMLYLTRVVAIVNKISNKIENLNISNFKNITDDELKTVENDLSFIQKIFKRRPHDILAFHFDIITDILWVDNKNYSLIASLNSMCQRLKNNNENRTIVDDSKRTKTQICPKLYTPIYQELEDVLLETKDSDKLTLRLLFQVLNPDNIGDLDVFKIVNQNENLVNTFKTSIKYAYDLGIPIYLKYLQMNIKHYKIILSFTTGSDWWNKLRSLYNGPIASNFLDFAEKSIDVAEDFLKDPDQVHLVRLLSDINLNNTDLFCQNNISISEYLPDSTGHLADINRQLCMEDNTDILRDIPPMVFASQGYSQDLKLSTDINYDDLYSDLNEIEEQLFDLLLNGVKSPMTPSWATEKRIERLRKVALGLMNAESMTKIAFGALSNMVDAGTLFLNNSHCPLCSDLTKWFKQLNLQLFKKQEYDNLLCHIDEMIIEEVYTTLKNDFHWDMAIGELLSSRNYTKHELNKSINEFLDHVKLHLLEQLNKNHTKISECLLKNVTRNGVGNITLFVTVLSKTTRMIRSQLPHLYSIPGIALSPYFQMLSTEIAHNLDVYKPVKDILNADKEDVFVPFGSVLNGEINLKLMKDNKDKIIRLVSLKNPDIEDFCKKHDCDMINKKLFENINWTLVDNELPTLQTKKFWRFEFVSEILYHIESLLNHVARILGVASYIDMNTDSSIAMLDFAMQMLTDDTFDSVIYSIQGLAKELLPLLRNTPLEVDLQSLATGLTTIRDFKNYVIRNVDLKFQVSEMFPNGDAIESTLLALGINHTNFWSQAAPRIRDGDMDFKPLLPIKQNPYHISSYICEPENAALVMSPIEDSLTTEDVLVEITEQFCENGDASKLFRVIPPLLGYFNYSVAIDKMASMLLAKLYTASNLTEERGSTLVARYSEVMSLLPVVQENIGSLGEELVKEPLFQSLRNFSSFGSLLGSSDLLPKVGTLLCGTPFYNSVSRIYKAVVSSEDLSQAPDRQQLESLPTDYCRSLYKDIISVEGGKIVWSFIKPLVMGKILYTPNTPAVNEIIAKANSSFAHMIRITSLLKDFAGSFPYVEGLSRNRDALRAMTSLMTSLDLPAVVDVDDVFDDFDGVMDVGSLLQRASNTLECFDLNRFKAVRDEDELTHEAAELTINNEFSNGLVFLKADLGKDGSPPDVEYKIRMDIENVPTTSRLKSLFWIPGPESNFLEDMRYFRGFVQIQDMIDKAVIEVASSRNRVTRDVSDDQSSKYAIYTQQMPYPCYRKDYFQTSMYESQALIVAFFFSLLLTVCSAVRLIVHEKQTLNTMLMSIMGVEVHLISISWLLSSLVEVLASAALATVLLKYGGILPRTEPSVIFSLIALFGLSVLSFCFLISRFLSSAGVGAVVAGLAYLITFMPFVIVLALETTISYLYRCMLCLSMSSSFCYTLLFLSRFEATGEGFTWSLVWNARTEDDSMTVGHAAGFLLLDAVLYAALAVLWERYYGIKAIKSNITIQPTTPDKAGVSIINITKIYNKNSRKAKLALDNVSIELQQGKITTLLGHNGAGKTTLLKILTGMLAPTSGEVVIRCGGARVGVCPQHDVLFDSLTPREHIALYEALAGPAARGNGEKVLKQLCLGEFADVPASKLSGGMRRRLCVALAFAGAAGLVSLDEPTANVDPKARRDIWALITRLKEDRTILLTTHHMDEAELLSDQIVIMHKGQVHTTGSPIEIKRSLGNGYKLYITYPDNVQLTHEDQLVDLEERTKHLLALVRSVVKNAAIVEIAGFDVEILLPFYDENGIHNNFLKLFQTLESNEEVLGYNKMSIDCCTLEQVFYNICGGHAEQNNQLTYEPDVPSKSGSSLSIRNDQGPLLSEDGPLAASPWEQFKAMLHVQYLHYSRNYWQLFMLIVLPTLFVAIAMLFSLIRPPADNEIALHLTSDLYPTTEFIIPHPSMYGDYREQDVDFADKVMQEISDGKIIRDWTLQDTPYCECTDDRQVCYNATPIAAVSQMVKLPEVDTLNDWLVKTQEQYIEKRYGGFTTVVKDNITNFVVWYNNKGHHALPAYLSAMNSAIMKYKAGGKLRTYTHPLKISQEQLTKDNVYQHVADAGISCLVVVAACVAGGGAAAAAVRARRDTRSLLLALRAAPPVATRAAALAPHAAVFLINSVIMAIILHIFGFPVFVYGANLPATCILFFMFGISCGCLGLLLERWWSDAGLATMALFCGNAFIALSGITLLLIMDIISQSETTDAFRYWLHKAFLLFPQFVLADGLLEIAKNTIKAQVLMRFGMDTYQNPLSSSLLGLHYTSLVATTVLFIVILLMIDYGVFQRMWIRFRPTPSLGPLGLESSEVTQERDRVTSKLQKTIRLNTLGNINAGFIDSDETLKSRKKYYRQHSATDDILSCVDLTKIYPMIKGSRKAVDRLTIGFAPGQCTVLLGQNGAGKSTTFGMLTGEILPSAGSIYVNGEEIDSRALHTGIISYCPQTNPLDPFLTVKETMQFYCRLSAIKNEEEAISRALQALGLSHAARTRCGALSGGTARRVATALALLPRAPLLCLDEPGSGMDPGSRALLAAAVRAWCGTGGGAGRGAGRGRNPRAALVSTHAVNDLRSVPHTVALMHHGRLHRLFHSRDNCAGLNSGYIISARVMGAARASWRHVRDTLQRGDAAVSARVTLRAAHADTLRLHVANADSDGKENGIRISDIFCLMATLQANCDIEDYTINQTSLDEMFLSFSNKNDEQESDRYWEDEKYQPNDEDLHVVTSL